MSYFNEGNKYYNNKDYSKAIENYIESIEVGENESCAYYNAGVCYIKLKDFNSAIEMLKKALSIQKESKYYFNLLKKEALNKTNYDKNYYDKKENKYQEYNFNKNQKTSK